MSDHAEAMLFRRWTIIRRWQASGNSSAGPMEAQNRTAGSPMLLMVGDTVALAAVPASKMET